MTWTILIPVKPPGTRKLRLASRMGTAARDALVDRMLFAVLDAVRGVPACTAVTVTATPLNAALADARAELSGARFAVIHADLPHLVSADVAALLLAADTHGIAIAPDRHERGTNALAIGDDRPFPFAFGPDSFLRHCARAPDAAIVRRRGLALDLDEPADLDLL